MSRWQPNAQERLEAAALDLYIDQGFERTTVAEIAARAGVTERTFFRHFTDKREVLFGGSSDLQAVLSDAVTAAPDSASPIEAVAAAMQAAATTFFEGRRERARRRQSVISQHAGLQERDAAKLSTVASAMTDALHARGAADHEARLAAEAGVVVLKVAFDQWLHGPDRELEGLFLEHFAALASVVGGT